ncbi:MAG TPA: hypothetical protein VJ802_13355 [Gemmatimonadaceae bacterium]|nr:hypothetical protein [Gemmatimonadaceae bacterium]
MASDEGAASDTNPFLRDRIMRKLETLSNDRLYQVLDYVEFLESRYAERQPTAASVFQRFTEGLEDTMRAGRLSADTIAQTMGLMSRAMGVLSGVAAAGKSVASDVVNAASRPAQWSGTRPPSGQGATGQSEGQQSPPPSSEPPTPTDSGGASK